MEEPHIITQETVERIITRKHTVTRYQRTEFVGSPEAREAFGLPPAHPLHAPELERELAQRRLLEDSHKGSRLAFAGLVAGTLLGVGALATGIILSLHGERGSSTIQLLGVTLSGSGAIAVIVSGFKLSIGLIKQAIVQGQPRKA